MQYIEKSKAVCQRVVMTWHNINTARAHVKFSEAFLVDQECDAATALNYMDVTPEEIFNSSFSLDE